MNLQKWSCRIYEIMVFRSLVIFIEIIFRIRSLFYLKSFQAFKGYDETNAKWIASITTLSGALNGSTITYIYGMKWASFVHILLLLYINLSFFSDTFYISDQMIGDSQNP